MKVPQEEAVVEASILADMFQRIDEWDLDDASMAIEIVSNLGDAIALVAKRME